MIIIPQNEEIKKEWLDKLNTQWSLYLKNNKLKHILEVGVEGMDFFDGIQFVDVSYFQMEEGLTYESATIRRFELNIIYQKERYVIGSAEILGEGPSDWVVNPHILMDDNEHVIYTVASETDSTLSKEFGLLECEDETIQKVFREFNLYHICEEYEKEVLVDDSRTESKNLLDFLQSNKIVDVSVKSRVLEIIDESGNAKKYYLSESSYANHF